jgi:hypothetical protein
VYATCLFCKGPLGRNEAIEHFQVGRRLAYDATRGRLWVVCARCERWNLTPLESRWEAIEEAERAYRGSRLRVATDNIGLARLREGLELVRVGTSPRLELATWRYGDQFGRRRRKFIAISAAGIAIPLLYVAATAVGTAAALFGSGISLANSGAQFWQRRRDVRVPRVVVRYAENETLALTANDIRQTQLNHSGDGWSVTVQRAEQPAPRVGVAFAPTRKAILVGDDAERALASLLPYINSNGGSGRRVRQAVELIGTTTAARELVQSAALLQNKTVVPNLVAALPENMRLALEMALHEDDERRAMEGELSRLEDRWREAEEIASIADMLLVPAEIEMRLDALRARARSE